MPKTFDSRPSRFSPRCSDIGRHPSEGATVADGADRSPVVKVLRIGGVGAISPARAAGPVTRADDACPHARTAAGRPPHPSSASLPIVASGPCRPAIGDPAHRAVFDTTINRYVPSYRPVITRSDGVLRPCARRTARAGQARPDDAADALLTRLVEARHHAHEALAGPEPTERS